MKQEIEIGAGDFCPSISKCFSILRMMWEKSLEGYFRLSSWGRPRRGSDTKARSEQKENIHMSSTASQFTNIELI